MDVKLEVFPEMQHIFNFLPGTAPEADEGGRQVREVGSPETWTLDLADQLPSGGEHIIQVARVAGMRESEFRTLGCGSGGAFSVERKIADLVV